MFALFEHNDEFYTTNSEARAQLASLVERSGVTTEEIEHKRGEALEQNPDSLFIVKNGVIRIERATRVLYFLEPGDLLGMNTGYDDSSKIICHSPVTLVEIKKTAFYKTLASTPELHSEWDTTIALQFELFNKLLSKLLPAKLPPAPDVRYIAPGEPIIIQEASRSEVFTLLHGRALVYVQDTEVGEILPGEIFGAMAAPIKSTRTASVLAITQCVVSALPQEQFLALVNSHPQTVQKLVKTMSRVIMSQNEQILGLKTK